MHCLVAGCGRRGERDVKRDDLRNKSVPISLSISLSVDSSMAGADWTFRRAAVSRFPSSDKTILPKDFFYFLLFICLFFILFAFA